MSAVQAPSDFALVIFDNDGVLVDSESIAHDVLRSLLAESGWQIDQSESVSRFLGTSVGFVRDSARDLGIALPDDFERRYHDQLFRRFRSELRVVDGVGSILQALRVAFCVASSGSHVRIRRSLEQTGLWRHFEGRAFSADDVPHGKPEPDLFLYAARCMDVEPSRCVVIEDSPSGLEAARRAGIPSVGFAFRTPEERLSAASLGIVRQMSDLPRLLPTLFSSPHRPQL